MNTRLLQKKKKVGNIYNPINLFLETYNYVCFESEESPDTTKTNEKSTHLPPMPPLEEDQEEVKEGKGLKILTPNQLLTRLPVLLAQIKAGNNQCNFLKKLNQANTASLVSAK